MGESKRQGIYHVPIEVYGGNSTGARQALHRGVVLSVGVFHYLLQMDA